MSVFDRFDGHRIYDGCPDSTMQRRLDNEAAALKELTDKYPGVFLTYFPGGADEGWRASRVINNDWSTYEPLTGSIKTGKMDCIIEAMSILDMRQAGSTTPITQPEVLNV